MRRGIYIAKPGKPIKRTGNQFQTDKPHLLVNLQKKPVHMDILSFEGGRALVSSGVSDQKETLVEIEHGLSYTPEVLVFFYVKSYAGSPTDPLAGQYADKALYYSGSNGAVFDTLYAKVDGQSLKIIHELDDQFGFGYTSDADDYEIQLKYYILSKDSGVLEYNTRGY